MPVPAPIIDGANLSEETQTKLRKAVEESLQPKAREAHRAREQALSRARGSEERDAAESKFEQAMTTLRATANERYKQSLQAYLSGSSAIDVIRDGGQSSNMVTDREQPDSTGVQRSSSPNFATSASVNDNGTSDAQDRSPVSKPLRLPIDENTRSRLKREIEESLGHLVRDAQLERAEALSKAQTDEERQIAYDRYAATMDTLKLLAVELYKDRLSELLMSRGSMPSTYKSSQPATIQALSIRTAPSQSASQQMPRPSGILRGTSTQEQTRGNEEGLGSKTRNAVDSQATIHSNDINEGYKKERSYERERDEMLQRFAALEGLTRTSDEIHKHEREVQRMGEEVQRKEEEVRRKVDNLKRQEIELKKMTEQMARRQEDGRKKEEFVIQKEREMGLRTAAVELREQEIQQREEETKIREESLRKQVEALQHKEDEMVLSMLQSQSQSKRAIGYHSYVQQRLQGLALGQDKNSVISDTEISGGGTAQSNHAQGSASGAMNEPLSIDHGLDNEIDASYWGLHFALLAEANRLELATMHLEEEYKQGIAEVVILESRLAVKREEIKAKEKAVNEAREVLDSITRGVYNPRSAAAIQPPASSNRQEEQKMFAGLAPVRKGQKAMDRIMERRKKEADKEAYTWFK